MTAVLGATWRAAEELADFRAEEMTHTTATRAATTPVPSQRNLPFDGGGFGGVTEGVSIGRGFSATAWSSAVSLRWTVRPFIRIEPRGKSPASIEFSARIECCASGAAALARAPEASPYRTRDLQLLSCGSVNRFINITKLILPYHYQLIQTRSVQGEARNLLVGELKPRFFVVPIYGLFRMTLPMPHSMNS